MKELLHSLVDGQRVWRAFGYSLQGLRAAYQQQSAFRQELVLAAVLIPLAFWLGGNGVEHAVLGGSVVLVLIVELLNSAIEAAVDRGGIDRDALATRAKDMGSAAVLVSLLLMATTWALILWDRYGP